MKDLLKFFGWIFPLAALAAVPGGTSLGFDPEKQPDAVASAYFAPENSFLFRMRNPDGSYREFQRNFDRPDALWSMYGWRGKIAGDLVSIQSPVAAKGAEPDCRYVFRKGRLVSFVEKGVRRDYAYETPRMPTAGGMPQVFGDQSRPVGASKAKETHPRTVDRKVTRELAKKWAGSGRLRVPFDNPNANGFLYMTVVLCATFLFFTRFRWVKILGGVLFVLGSAALVATASRGSFLALAVGLAPVALLKFRTVIRSKAVWILAAVVLVGAAGWFAARGSHLLTRGFSGKSRWSNEARLELWATAPKMMADAPGGWGDLHVGRASLDWYQALDEVSLNGSLMNDHFTLMVGAVRGGRFLYLFLWFGLLGVLGYTAVRSRNGVALGFAGAVFVAGWFNPVYDVPWLWILPGVGGALFLCTRPWRAWRPRAVGGVLGACALAAWGTLAGIEAWGASRPDAEGGPVHVEGNRVCVCGRNPQVWIVDDGRMLGGVMACKDIRGYYVHDPKAPPVGYVRRVADLPERKIRRLVLAGTACADWLKAFSERVEKTGVEALKLLPEELVFITPPFSPSEVPPPYLASCRTKLVIGEFAARYDGEYADPPAWVKVVPGMELYLNGWMRYVLGVF